MKARRSGSVMKESIQCTLISYKIKKETSRKNRLIHLHLFRARDQLLTLVLLLSIKMHEIRGLTIK